MIRVMIVDDSPFMRRAVKAMLAGDSRICVVGVACNGREAIEQFEKLKPDVITMDVEMPEMDGLTALRLLMRNPAPPRVLMFSTLTGTGSRAAIKALSLGAADVLAKDASHAGMAVHEAKDELVSKVIALGERARRDPKTPQHPHDLATRPPAFTPGQFDLVCIGSSTGGPSALEQIVGPLPQNFGPAVAIAQHMPRLFTASMSERLQAIGHLPVVHVEGRVTVKPATVYVACGGQHMHVRRLGLTGLELYISDEPKSAVYKPSVDALLSSAAAAVGARALGIVLTGIGQDGLIGATDLRSRGGWVIAQDEASSAVYGMPRAVTDHKVAQASLSPPQIAETLKQLIKPASLRAA